MMSIIVSFSSRNIANRFGTIQKRNRLDQDLIKNKTECENIQ